MKKYLYGQFELFGEGEIIGFGDDNFRFIEKKFKKFMIENIKKGEGV